MNYLEHCAFVYDNANELTAVTGSRSESYSYDPNGNRTGTGYSTTIMNEAQTSPGVTYSYDAAGNTISADSGGTFTTYSYDYHNRLTEVTQAGTVVATYTYNALDQRIGIQESGGQTWTVYNGTSADALPNADFNGSGTLLTRYVSGPGMVNGAAVDELLARTSSGGTTAWYLPDKLDSVRDIVSSSGSELDHVVYDSFGNILTETNASNGDRFKFAGMEFDSTSGTFFDHARWYSALTGKFLELDPTSFAAGDTNLYRYTMNGPLSATDPTGLQQPDPVPVPVLSPTRLRSLDANALYNKNMEALKEIEKTYIDQRDYWKEKAKTYQEEYMKWYEMFTVKYKGQLLEAMLIYVTKLRIKAGELAALSEAGFLQYKKRSWATAEAEEAFYEEQVLIIQQAKIKRILEQQNESSQGANTKGNSGNKQ